MSDAERVRRMKKHTRPIVADRSDTREARLTEWANGGTVSAQMHRPVYANPSELKADILALVSDVAALEAERATLDANAKEFYDRMVQAEAERTKLDATLSQIENISPIGSAVWEIARAALVSGEDA
jgi:DNA polymerase III delta prime subunit